MRQSSLSKHSRGFTLAEVLIALMILAEIVTFTVPKVLNSVQSSQSKSTFKETVATMQTLLYQGILEGEIIDAPSYKAYIMSHINAVKICASNSSTGGCWDTAIQGNPGSDTTKPGFILVSGARVTGIESVLNADGSDGAWIDWNGVNGPNIVGEDQLKIVFCVTGSNCTNIDSYRPHTKGFVGPAGNAPHPALYDTIFQ